MPTTETITFHISSHTAIADQITGAVLRSATSHSVGAVMRGHSVPTALAIAIVLIVGVWFAKRFL